MICCLFLFQSSDFDLIKSFELANRQITGVGRIDGYPGEPEEAYRFDKGLEKLHLGPEFVSDLAEVSRESNGLTITANMKLDRKSYGTLFSLETEGEGKIEGSYDELYFTVLDGYGWMEGLKNGWLVVWKDGRWNGMDGWMD